jgi:hypothetical protein
VRQRDETHQPVTVKELAMTLPTSAWKNVYWREGVNGKLQSRFAAVRVRPAHRDYERSEPRPEEWLLIEWPAKEKEPPQILAVHASGRYKVEGSGALGQASLDYGARLRGTETRTGLGTLRRSRLARISSSRHIVHRSLRVPDGRAEPFFPLSARRQCWTMRPATAAGLPPARVAALGPSGIIRTG